MEKQYLVRHKTWKNTMEGPFKKDELQAYFLSKSHHVQSDWEVFEVTMQKCRVVTKYVVDFVLDI